MWSNSITPFRKFFKMWCASVLPSCLSIPGPKFQPHSTCSCVQSVSVLLVCGQTCEQTSPHGPHHVAVMYRNSSAILFDLPVAHSHMQVVIKQWTCVSELSSGNIPLHSYITGAWTVPTFVCTWGGHRECFPPQRSLELASIDVLGCPPFPTFIRMKTKGAEASPFTPPKPPPLSSQRKTLLSF